MPNARAHLSPDLSPLLEEAIERARPGIGSIVRLRATPEERSALSPVLEEHDPRHVARLTHELRRRVDETLTAAVGHDSDSGTRRARRALALTPDLAPILSTSGSGYIRQAALDTFASLEGPFALALLLRRVTDWVPEVRRAARAALERVVHDVRSQDVDESISVCAELLLADPTQRRQIDEWLATRRRLLERPGVEEAIERLVREGDEDRAPRVFGLALRAGQLRDIAPSLATHATHPAVRRLALTASFEYRLVSNAATDTKLETPLDALARSALEDRSAEVRRVAFHHVAARPESAFHTKSFFRASLLDTNATLSNAARFALVRLGADPVPTLLDALEGPVPSFAAARLLAREPRHREAIARAHESFAEPRLSWLGLLAPLGDRHATATLRDAVTHSSDEARSRQASRLLWKAGERFDETELTAIARTGANIVERGLLRHVAACSALAIVRTIAVLARVSPDIDTEVFWEAAARKRRIAAFYPTDAELDALRQDLDTLPAVIARARSVLGVPLEPH